MDLDCGAKFAGFKFPVVLSNYHVRAMNGILEVTYPLDEFRNVIVRKSNKFKTDTLSGVYIDYPVNTERCEVIAKSLGAKFRAREFIVNGY